MSHAPAAVSASRYACGGQGESVRHPDALGRKDGIKLPKRSVLAAHQADIVEPNIAEPTDIALSVHRVVVLNVKRLAGAASNLLICLNGSELIQGE